MAYKNQKKNKYRKIVLENTPGTREYEQHQEKLQRKRKSNSKKLNIRQTKPPFYID